MKSIGHNNIEATLTDEGELVSIQHNRVEFMHPGGHPEATDQERDAWSNSEITLFPIVGPAKDDILTNTDTGLEYTLNQHGLIRNMVPDSVDVLERRAQIRYVYEGETLIRAPHLTRDNSFWRSFTLIVRHKIPIDSDALVTEHQIINSTDELLPYALGWHPSFLFDDENDVVAFGKAMSIRGLRNKPGSFVQGESSQLLYVSEGRTLQMNHSFLHSGIWTRGSQFCFEALTHYMVDDANEQFLKDNQLVVPPNSTHTYTTHIFPRTKRVPELYAAARRSCEE